MRRLLKKIPQYLREEYQLTATVVFTAFFSLVLILVSIPFSHNAWFELGTGAAFGYTASFFVIGLLVIVFSKRMMYITRNKISMNYLQYVLWNLAEVIVICLLYTMFSIRGDAAGVIRIQDPSFTTIFFNALVYCFTSLVTPYVIAGMYFAIIDKNNTIRLMNYSDTVSDEPPRTRNEKKITIFDNRGTMSLSVSLTNLYFIESDDNYIKVWYTDSEFHGQQPRALPQKIHSQHRQGEGPLERHGRLHHNHEQPRNTPAPGQQDLRADGAGQMLSQLRLKRRPMPRLKFSGRSR